MPGTFPHRILQCVVGKVGIGEAEFCAVVDEYRTGERELDERHRPRPCGPQLDVDVGRLLGAFCFGVFCPAVLSLGVWSLVVECLADRSFGVGSLGVWSRVVKCLAGRSLGVLSLGVGSLAIGGLAVGRHDGGTIARHFAVDVVIRQRPGRCSADALHRVERVLDGVADGVGVERRFGESEVETQM
ncbi:Uncharacterised protein [Mycobacteroides abscessus subsp. abscessus]|nr:Uncharacterised protein [Mycobacteroides abscessus subsp. abscessus]